MWFCALFLDNTEMSVICFSRDLHVSNTFIQGWIRNLLHFILKTCSDALWAHVSMTPKIWLHCEGQSEDAV